MRKTSNNFDNFNYSTQSRKKPFVLISGGKEIKEKKKKEFKRKTIIIFSLLIFASIISLISYIYIKLVIYK